MAGKIITKEKENNIVQLYLNGSTFNEIRKELHTSNVTIEKVLKNNNIPIRQHVTPCKYYCNTHFLDNLDTPEKNYFVGFFSADGYNSYDKNEIILELQEKDIEFLTKLNNLFDNERPVLLVKKILNGKVYNSARICLHGKELCDNMNKYNCIKNKTATYSIPFFYNDISNIFVRDFVRGYIDGDGCIYYNKKKNDIKVSICCNGKTCSELKNIIYNHLNVVCSSFCKSNNTYYLEIHAKEDVIKFCNWIYYDGCLCLERKYKKFLDFINI